jgi:hypothetical protein
MLNFAKMVIFAYENGMELTAGEMLRTKDQQMLYFEGFSLIKIGSLLKMIKTTVKSKTMNSGHLNKLAVDVNLFIDGEYKTDKASFKKLSQFWKSLNPKNVSGYDWGWDFNHFEMKL